MPIDARRVGDVDAATEVASAGAIDTAWGYARDNSGIRAGKCYPSIAPDQWDCSLGIAGPAEILHASVGRANEGYFVAGIGVAE
jgi:hypothetical protein